MNNETVRAQIAAQIKADNPGYGVVAYGVVAPDNLGAGKVRVSVFRKSLDIGTNRLTHNMIIQVVAAGTTLAAEDNLDAVLDQVILSLGRMPGVIVTSADRVVHGDTFIGYDITAEAVSTDVYREIISQERS